MRTFLRRVKGALVNAAFWSVALGTFGVVMHVGIRLATGEPIYLPVLLATGLAAASQGFVLGALFSAYLAFAFRHERAEDLSRVRFTVGGALVAMLVSLVAVHVGDPDYIVHLMISDPWELAQGLLAAATFGGGVAFGTISLAQRGAGTERLERGRERLLVEELR